eukprot:TRINITY_DN55923_c0_g1_i1.p1 TRINITY_DN55923_c0_g1~~TRINITY_DN55923_c0_g1_i1.p1  ORF type:complete len:209 (+),score=16.28 TRINITY_DN55923_c0_g1_i1:135-761(+)
MTSLQRVDYAERGRELMSEFSSIYARLNPILCHPETGARVFVGDHRIASDREALTSLDINCIVFCQESDGRCHFDGEDPFVYCRFPIGSLAHREDAWRTDADVIRTFTPLFHFVQDHISSGRNVLIHCLAGAHRAGTAGIACIMHFCEKSAAEAQQLAQERRPIIEPIGNFRARLQLLERARAAQSCRPAFQLDLVPPIASPSSGFRR